MTTEQLTAVKTISSESCKLLSIQAISGSGKTFLLTKIAEKLKPKNGLYIAYSKAIAY